MTYRDHEIVKTDKSFTQHEVSRPYWLTSGPAGVDSRFTHAGIRTRTLENMYAHIDGLTKRIAKSM
tara:strand:+ start:286 stop:483 length:198 start_codon:yes stop_codon:yes gene_type:complete